MIMELQSCLLINPIDFDYIHHKEGQGRRGRGTGTLVHNIELLCHDKLERYQRLTFITSYFVA